MPKFILGRESKPAALRLDLDALCLLTVHRNGQYCFGFDFSPLCHRESETMHGLSLSKEDSER